jgi:hypothetical protein
MAGWQDGRMAGWGTDVVVSCGGGWIGKGIILVFGQGNEACMAHEGTMGRHGRGSALGVLRMGEAKGEAKVMRG